jgi:hypothetical protein
MTKQKSYVVQVEFVYSGPDVAAWIERELVTFLQQQDAIKHGGSFDYRGVPSGITRVDLRELWQ